MRGKSKTTWRKIEILKEQYKIEGALTARRCYYILLAKGLVKPKGYNGLDRQMVEWREDGLLDWKIITDKSRRIDQRLTWHNADQSFWYGMRTYREDSMEYQDKYVVVWIEKDAISANVGQITYDIDVPLIIGRGWNSATYIYKAVERFKEKDKEVVILYISDLDPEGEHIPKIVERKLHKYGYHNFRLDKIAINEKEVKKYKLPDNIGFSISRKAGHWNKAYVQDYIKKHGERQVELDAMSVVDLNNLLDTELRRLIDYDIVKAIDKKAENEVKKWLKEHYKS